MTIEEVAAITFVKGEEPFAIYDGSGRPLASRAGPPSREAAHAPQEIAKSAGKISHWSLL